MRPLEITPVETQVLDPVGEQQKDTSVPPNAARILSEYYSEVLTKDSSEIELQILNGFEETFKNQANGISDERLSMDFSDRIRTAVEAGDDPEMVLQEMRQKIANGNFGAPHISILMEGKELNDRDLRQLDRLVRANDIVQRLQENQSKGFIAGVGYFGDVLVSDPLQSIVGGLANLVGVGDDTFEEATRRRELAIEAADLINTDLPIEEFEEEFSAILTRVADAGLFTENNPFILDEFISMIEEFGGGKDTRVATTFQVLDIATAGYGAITMAISKGIRRLGNVPRVVAKTKGHEEGVRKAVDSVDKNPSSPVTAELQPKLTRAADPDTLYLSAPDHAAIRQAEASNWVLDYMRKFEKPAFTDPEIFRQRYTSMVADVRSKLAGRAGREIDVDVADDGLGNIVGSAILGNNKARPFNRKSDATKLANQIGGEVRETVDAGVTKFVVRKEWNLSSEGLAVSTDLNDIGGAFAAALTSTTRNTSRYLDGVLKWGEGAKSRAIKEIGKRYDSARSQVSKTERANVDEIFRQLRDEPEFSMRKEMYDEREFIDHYVRVHGDTPSDEAKRLWQTVSELNDADYFLNADPLLKEAVSNGETMVRLDGQFYHSKRVTLSAGEQVYDPDIGKWRYLKADEEAYAIKDFRYAPNGVGAVQYVAKANPVERRLTHSDVLAYNVGGHRKYASRVDNFIKQEGSITLGNGTAVPRAPKAFMAVRGEATAIKMTDEFNSIVDSINSGASRADIDDVIRANANWDDTIQNLDDFKRFADDQGISWNTRVSYAPDGEELISQGGKHEVFASGRTIDRAFRESYMNRSRSVKPLIGYDSNPLDTISPMRVVERNMASTISRAVDSAYINRAGKGLLQTIDRLEKEGQNHVKNWDDLAGKTAAQQVRDMQFKNTEIGKKLGRERDTILRQLDRGSPELEKQRAILGKAADFVYGHKDKAGRMGIKASQSADWLADQDWAAFVRSTAFHTKLGTLSVDQFLVQASQSINAVAISSNTLGVAGAVRAATGGHWLQAAVASNNPEVIRRLAQSQAPVTGVSAEDFMLLREWAAKTGRFIIDRTAVEENRDAVIAAGTKARIANISTTFFRAGEVNARAAAAMLNMAEMRKKGRLGTDLLSDAMSREMFNRQDILTASMTASSAAGWQRSFLAIPLQFMTYNARILEQLFTPDVLTKGERIRMATAHVFLYGGAGVPAAGYMMDKYGYEGALDPSTKAYHAARYGAMDAALSRLTEAVGGSETALSTRIAVGDGLFRLGQDMGTEGLVDLLIGPGGATIKDGLSASVKVLDGLFSGASYDTTAYNLNRLGRIFSSYDDGFKLWAAATYGQYWTRNTGVVTTDNLNTVDGLTQLFGIPMADQQRLWTTLDFQSQRKKGIESIYSEVVELSRVVSRRLESGDYDGVGDVMMDIRVLIEGLPIGSRKEALQRIQRDGVLSDNIARTILRDGPSDIQHRMKIIGAFDDS